MKKLAAKKVVIGRVKSSSNPKITHTQYKIGDKKFCTCMGFKVNRNCKHIDPKGENQVTNRKAAPVKGKTVRAMLINMLLKNKGKVVTIESVRTNFQKVNKTKEKVTDERITKRAKLAEAWAKQRKMKVVKKGSGFVLQTA